MFVKQNLNCLIQGKQKQQQIILKKYLSPYQTHYSEKLRKFHVYIFSDYMSIEGLLHMHQRLKLAPGAASRLQFEAASRSSNFSGIYQKSRLITDSLEGEKWVIS